MSTSLQLVLDTTYTSRERESRVESPVGGDQGDTGDATTMGSPRRPLVGAFESARSSPRVRVRAFEFARDRVRHSATDDVSAWNGDYLSASARAGSGTGRAMP